MSVLVITPPAPLVELEDAKAHLRVTDNGEDELIQFYIDAASAWIDGPNGWLGRSIGEQTIELHVDVFDCVPPLPYGPVQSIEQIRFLASGGIEETLAADVYGLVHGRLILNPGSSWPAVRGDVGGVRIRYVAGELEPLPQVRQAVLLLIGQWFRNRMAVVVGTISSSLPFGVDALLSPLRRFQ